MFYAYVPVRGYKKLAYLISSSPGSVGVFFRDKDYHNISTITTSYSSSWREETIPDNAEFVFVYSGSQTAKFYFSLFTSE